MKRAIVCALAAATMLIGLAAPAADATTVKAKTYANCTALNKRYPHGVGLHGAHDHTSGKPVTNFTRNNAVYRANTKSDRDKDHIACEKA